MEILFRPKSFEPPKLVQCKDLTKYKVESVALSHFYASFPTYVANSAQFPSRSRLSFRRRRRRVMPFPRNEPNDKIKWFDWQ